MKKKTYITLFIISIIFLGIGGTLAAITASGIATNITQIKSGNLTMTVDGGGSENVSLMPATCTSEYAIKKTINASAVNTSGGRVSFSIGMNITTLGNDLKRSTMKYALTTSATSCTDSLIAEGNFSNKSVGSDVWLIKNDYDNITNTGNNYTKTYYLYIWLDSAETQNVTGSVSVTMKGSASNNPDLITEVEIPLYNMIRDNADTTTQIDFSNTTTTQQLSSNSNNPKTKLLQNANLIYHKKLLPESTAEVSITNGIYTTVNTESGTPVYYYRGNVDNRIIFANFCWRIVRTTETGGVKIVYDGVPNNGQCNNSGNTAFIGGTAHIGNSVFNNNYNDAKYVGYMYGSSIDDINNTNDSTIKTFIDNWYLNNMTSYTSQLEDTVFCNDRTYRTIDTTLYFATYDRLYINKAPTLQCTNTKDKFTVNESNGNGDLTYPIGLLTADEVALAGGVYDISNNSYYLYYSLATWTGSPYSFNNSTGYGFGLHSDGTLNYRTLGHSIIVRPAVSLKPGTTIVSGTGTETAPYIVARVTDTFDLD